MSFDIYWRFVLALAFVVLLIAALAWLVRRFGLGGRLATAGGKRRLAIVEVLPLDGKRRLVLLRRDGAEHLVLLGVQSDLLVESGIRAGAGPQGASFAAMVEGSGAAMVEGSGS